MLIHRIKFLLPVLLPCYLFSQEHYAFQHLTIDDGLLSNSKVSTYQDSKGFYWFGSVNGIQRFDGKNFVTYKYDSNSAKNISDNWITFPEEDREENIWIDNEEGINIYRRKERKFFRLYMPDNTDSNKNNVACIEKDKHSQIWIVTSKNIFLYSYEKRKAILINQIITKNSAADGVQSAVYDDKHDCFWILFAGRQRIIARFDCISRKLYYPPENNVDELLGHYNPISLFKLDKDGNLWIANYLGDLCSYNTYSNEIKHYDVLHQRNKEKIGTPNSTVYEILDDGNNTIWFAGDYYIGLLKYDKKSKRFSFVQNENGSEYGLHYDEDIYSLFEDHEGNIWIDTDLGLNIFNPDLQQFKYLEKTTGSSITQFSADVTSIYESKKKDIWISTWGNGIFKYDSNFAFQKNYVHDKRNPKSLGEPLNRTWAFAEDNDNKLWIGCQYGMLSFLNTTTEKFINKIIPGFEKYTVTNLAKDKKNNIWVALHNGNLAKWDAEAAKIIFFKNLLKDNIPIDGLCVDSRNNVWITAGKYGLCKFDESNKILAHNILPAQHNILISSLNDSIITGSTADNRIFFYNTFTGATLFFNIANTASSNNIQGVFIHAPGDVWILTNEEIDRLNTNNLKISSFNINDGVRDRFFEQACMQTSKGNILVAGHSGVIYFNPDSIKTIPPPPDVSITDLNIEQQNLSVDSLMQYDSIELSHYQNEISINYSSLSFIGRNTDQYFYQMEGVDRDWIFADQKTFGYICQPCSRQLYF